jgi:hypothetical protein
MMVHHRHGRHGQKTLISRDLWGAAPFLSYPGFTLIAMDRDEWCEHKPVWVGRVAVAACDECGRVDWFSNQGSVDHAEAIAALFGTYDLQCSIDALGAPSPRVLVYAPPSERKRRHLDALPRRAWLKAGPHLWMSTDGEVLLLATTEPLLFENLTRGA